MSEGFLAYRRGQILDALRARLRMVRRAAGYVTDAGLYVSFGRTPASDDSEFPRLALIVPGDTITAGQGKKVQRRLVVTVEGIDLASEPDPLEAAEALLGDIKVALFRPDDKELFNLLSSPDSLAYGEERHLERDPGSKYVGVQVDALLTWVEGYGDPR